MLILIDGYNLMHALVVAPWPRTAGSLERARSRFLGWLRKQPGAQRDPIEVVFDSSGQSTSVKTISEAGFRLIFPHGETADDYIEDRIAAAVHPAALTIVSTDKRLMLAAKRRGCRWFSSQEFIDQVRQQPPPPQKTTSHTDDRDQPDPTPEEIAKWLRTFEG